MARFALGGAIIAQGVASTPEPDNGKISMEDPPAIRAAGKEETNMRRFGVVAALLAAVLVLPVEKAGALSYLATSVKVIDPNPPGGSIDIQARLYAQML